VGECDEAGGGTPLPAPSVAVFKMDEQNISPEFYVVNRVLSDEQKNAVRHALSMTPIQCAMVMNVYDLKLAKELGAERIFSHRYPAEARAHAQELFSKHGDVSLVIDKAIFLEGHYGNGRVETIA
jgi:hypothetical protein